MLGVVLGIASAVACGPGRDEPSAPAPDGAMAAAGGDGADAKDEAPAVGAEERPEGSEPRPSSKASESKSFVPGPEDVPPTHFEGREIASTMSHLGAPWLTRSNRDAEEDTTGLHRALGLKPGQTACDVGAGNGYHTLRMAKAVGPTGRVLAVDIQPKMLELLRERMDEAGLENVELIEGRPGDPRLPAGACDLILLVDVYHELAWPEAMLAAFRRALSDEGRVALVEFREEDPKVPIKRLHKMSRAQIDREYSSRGFEVVGSFDELPWQHLVFFGKG